MRIWLLCLGIDEWVMVARVAPCYEPDVLLQLDVVVIIDPFGVSV